MKTKAVCFLLVFVILSFGFGFDLEPGGLGVFNVGVAIAEEEEPPPPPPPPPEKKTWGQIKKDYS